MVFAPRRATWPQVRQILLGSKCQHTASIYRVWWELIEKGHHSCQECTIWSFFTFFAPRCAKPRHATWPQVRQILLGSKCEHTASIYRVWWESIKKWHHSCQECTIWSFFMVFAPRCPTPRHTTWPQVRQMLLGSKYQHTASIYRVSWESIEKWQHSCQECTIWSFFYGVCATLRHATWPQVRQILLGSKCQHTASIYRVWWESIEK
jgi:hypothetical protein